MLRVLQYAGEMNRGGLETFLMNVHRNIDRSKIQFDYMLHPDEKQDYEDEINELGGICHRIKVSGKPYAHYIQYRNFLDSFFVQHPEYKIVHGHLYTYMPIYLNAAKRHGRITIAHTHATRNPNIAIKGFLKRMMNYSVRYIADYFFACSTQAGIDNFGRKANAKFVPNGIDTRNYKFSENVRTRIRNNTVMGGGAEFIVGHVGRFEHQKNHKFLIEVFHQIHSIIPNSRLWLIGRGYLEADIRAQVHSLGLDDAVDFIGVVGNVNEYLTGMDAFIFPSVYEGLGIALIEAEASGLPCFVSEAIQDEAVVSDRVTRMSLNESPEIWAEKIIQCRGQNINREAYAEVVSRSGFDIRNVAKELQEFYLSLV